MSLMGMDIGTTGAKAVIVSEDGGIRGAGYAEYGLYHPRPGWAELNPEEVWRAVRSAVRMAVQKVGDHDPVCAVAAATHGDSVIPVDDQGRALGPAMASFDPRAAPQSARLSETLTEHRLFELTGMPPNPMYSIHKIAWWKENLPALYQRTARFYSFGEYILARLGIQAPAIDCTMAARTGAMDRDSFGWSQEILAASRIDPALLPPIVPSGLPQGSLSRTAAEDLGLSSRALAVVGGHDQPCGALGAGVLEPGVALDSTGTVECITAVLPGPGLNDLMLSGHYPSYPHVVDGQWITIAFNFTGGVLLRWFRDQLGEPEVGRAAAEGIDAYHALIGSAADHSGGVFVLPHFAGVGNPSFDSEATGAVVGLRLSTRRGEIIRAVLEGITYELKLNLENLAEAGSSVTRLRAVGGGARSPVWLQLKADIFGIPVSAVSSAECAAVGAAMLAGQGCGQFSSAAEVAGRFVQETVTYEPDPIANAYHEQRKEEYRRLYPALRSWRT